MELWADPAFWLALGEIIWVNILLSGDNAVVIALAARDLPGRQRRRAVVFGSAAAIALRVVLTVFAVQLLQYPYLKSVGAVLLFWIGAKLIVPDTDEGEGSIHAQQYLWAAVRTILVADLVMSLDNVIAVAAAAESGPPPARFTLLVVGLGLSIPLIIVGSQMLMRVMERWPLIITLGAALLGFVAGEMMVQDPVLDGWFDGLGTAATALVGLAGAAGVVAVGSWLARRHRAERAVREALGAKKGGGDREAGEQQGAPEANGAGDSHRTRSASMAGGTGVARASDRRAAGDDG